ncbi:hypothetical protein SAMN05421503_1467 [Terribacillus aidingensis]|uniref:Uncharacterized protein n=1 Tax=Terribacillus aidingensis TaxID=586416 RepID=A0A285NM64_9BACI|nr:hypothetical protein [Terribacillus aidingensis]SNZ10013.1 hypothetical protein SAMN05421503_1467 [Terribacillus aidingensis]
MNNVLLVFVTESDHQAFLEERDYKLDEFLYTGSIQRGARSVNIKGVSAFNTVVFIKESKRPIDYQWYGEQIAQFVSDLRGLKLTKDSTVFV